MVLFVKNRAIEVVAPFSTTGLTVSVVYYDEARNASTGTATEIGVTANYYFSFTPDAEGDWRVVLYNASEKHVYHFAVYGSPRVTGTHTMTTTTDTVETQIFEVAKFGTYALSVLLDLDTLETAVEGGTVTIKLYNKIDAANYSDKPIARIDHVIGGTLEYPSFEAVRLGYYSKVTIQCSGNVSVSRAIPYYYITEDLDMKVT